MNQLQIFNNSEFGQVRTVEIEGKPYVVARDIALVLEYANPNDAIIRHCKGVVKFDTLTNGGRQIVNVIPEGDIYRLIIKAADQSVNHAIKSKAERFERWLFDEVLPTIRKTGQYGNAAYSLPTNYSEALRQLTATVEANEQLQEKVAKDAPKVEAYDEFINSAGLQTFEEVGKTLDIGRNRLIAFLREKKLIGKRRLPYQKYVERGYFELKVAVKNRCSHAVTLVTPTGIDYIHKLLKKSIVRPAEGLFLLEQ